MVTYAQLTSDIQAWTENDATEFTAAIDRIISLAELRVLREVDLTIAHKQDLTLSLSSGGSTITAPTDMVVPRWLRVQNGAYLLKKDESFIKEYAPSSSTTGSPKFYSYQGDGTTLLIGPFADVAYTLEIGYTYRIAGLSSSTTTNWLSTNAPDALFYACLIESSGFTMVEDNVVQRWISMYERARETLKREEETRRRTDEYRAKEKR